MLVNDLVQTDLAIIRFAWDCVDVMPNCTLGLFGDAIASCTPCKGVRIPEFRKFLPVESGIRKIRHVYEMGNPRLWNTEYSSRNPEYSSRNPESYYRLKSGIQVLLTKNPESSAWNSRIENWLGLPSMGQNTSLIGYCKIMRGIGSKSGRKTVPYCSSTTQSTVTCSNPKMTSKQAAPVK